MARSNSSGVCGCLIQWQVVKLRGVSPGATACGTPPTGYAAFRLDIKVLARGQGGKVGRRHNKLIFSPVIEIAAP
jgi:hypothetical protein